MATPAQKKVLFTSHVANFQKFNRPFMRMLSEQGYEVHYASDGEEKILDCDKEFTIPFQRSPFSFSNIKAIFQLKKVIDREGYDIIHTHTPMGSVVTRLAAVAARKKGARVIYTAHGFHFFKGAPVANWLIYYPIEKVMAHFTDTLITINLEDYNRAKLNFKTSVRYIPGVGVDPKKFNLDSVADMSEQDLRASLGLKVSDFVLIYVAEISNRKNQKWLINTLTDFMLINQDVHLLLVGKDSLNGAVERLVESRSLSGQIRTLGYREDVPLLMCSADLAISSSKQEGLAVNVIEAIYTGKLVLVSDCRGNKDLITTGSDLGYVYRQNDKESLLSYLQAARQSGRTVNTESYEAFKNKYSIDNIVRKMNIVYREKGL